MRARGSSASMMARCSCPAWRSTVCHGRVASLSPVGFERFPFNHPLFVLLSSGTTVAPKCILQGAGGTLLEHLKEHRLHCDLGPSDRLFFQTSTAWMMWNW
jgi:acetoacetyl-CoA synthetase